MAAVEKMSRNTAESISDEGMCIILPQSSRCRPANPRVQGDGRHATALDKTV
jgi:hypothetical protein